MNTKKDSLENFFRLHPVIKRIARKFLPEKGLNSFSTSYKPLYNFEQQHICIFSFLQGISFFEVLFPLYLFYNKKDSQKIFTSFGYCMAYSMVYGNNIPEITPAINDIEFNTSSEVNS